MHDKNTPFDLCDEAQQEGNVLQHGHKLAACSNRTVGRIGAKGKENRHRCGWEPQSKHRARHKHLARNDAKDPVYLNEL